MVGVRAARLDRPWRTTSGGTVHRLKSSAPAKIIRVSLRGQSPIAFDDVTLERGHTFSRACVQSKLAQIMFAIYLANSASMNRRTTRRHAPG